MNREGPSGTSRSAEAPLRVFISYRREDTADAAGRLYDALAARSGDQIFIDIDTIEPGSDYSEVIEGAVGSCDVLLALIGRQWLSVTDPAGHRRLDNDDDWVRLELEAALQRDVRVIPILLQDARMPTPDQLPASLEKLTRRNALEISHERWHYDFGRLEVALDRIRGRGMVADRKKAEQGIAVDTGRDGRAAVREERRSAKKGAVRPRRRPSALLRPRNLVVAGVAMLSAALVLWLVLRSEPELKPGAGSEEVTLEWTTVPKPIRGASGDTMIRSLATFPETGHYVAGGNQGDAAIVWTSEDGQSWTRRARWSEEGLNLTVTTVLVAPRQDEPDHVFAAGVADSGESSAITLARSDDDGETWFTVESPAFVGLADQAVTSARGTGTKGLLLAGWQSSEDGGTRAALWRSTNGGADWEQIPDADLDIGDQAVINRIACLPADGCRRLVAVGSSTTDGDQEATAWMSRDGIDWEPVVIRAQGDQQMNDVATFHSRLVAVGFDRSGVAHTDAAVWISTQGLRWRRVADRRGALGGTESRVAEEVVATGQTGGPGLVATGWLGEEGGASEIDAVVWTSDDGRLWVREPDPTAVLGGPGEQRILHVVARTYPVVAAGVNTGAEDGVGLWLGQLPSA